MLQLPSAWSKFISESTHGASCLGQLSGLEEQKDLYKKAVANLADSKLTTLMLVTRPEEGPILEANRASKELKEIGINNQMLIINGIENVRSLLTDETIEISHDVVTNSDIPSLQKIITMV